MKTNVHLFIVLVISALSYGRVDPKCKCGYHKYSKAKDPTKDLISPNHTNPSRIWQGWDAPDDRFPWQVLITMASVPPSKTTFCGGVVISKYHILTAAHCLEAFFDDK